MKAVIYLDILLLVNFLIGYLLLLVTAHLTGMQASVFRMLCAAGLCALFSLALIFPPFPHLFAFLYKVIGSILIVLAAFKMKNWRIFCRVYLWFFLLNALLAGFVLIAVLQGCFSGIEINNGSVYFNISPFVLLCSVLILYVIMRIGIFLFGRPSNHSIWTIRLTLHGRCICLSAFYDTGFFLKDPLSSSPAILVSYPSSKELLSEPLKDFLANYFSGCQSLAAPAFALRLIPCRAISGTSMLPAILLPSAELTDQNGKIHIIQHSLLVFCNDIFHDGSFDALFGSDLLN